jgi:hypothetical protein
LLDLTKKLKNMNLTIYLKTIGRNIDPSARITFPKSDLSLDGWIHVDHNFSFKKPKRKVGGKLEKRKE